MEDEDDESLSHLLSELQSHHLIPSSSTGAPPPLSSPSISALQSLLDGPDAPSLWPLLSSRGLPPSALLPPLSSSMDSSSPVPSLLASRCYLSLLLASSSPVPSLFSPLPFLSLLSSLRRSSKPSLTSTDSSSPPPDPTGNPCAKRGRKRGDLPSSASPHSPAADFNDLLLRILELLESVIACVRLDMLPDSVKSLTESIISIINGAAAPRLAELCFRILDSVLSRPEHGDQTISTMEVLRCLTPVILSCGKTSVLRGLALGFVVQRIIPIANGNSDVRKAVIYFPRYLVSKAPEKAELRAAAVEAILEVLRAMEREDQMDFTSYVVKMTRGKPQLRLLGVDLITGLLSTLRDPLAVEELEAGDGCDDWWGVRCLEALVQRCSDAQAGIRARALANIGQLMELLSKDLQSQQRLGKLMVLWEFSATLRKRCMDEKAAVRKAALLLVPRATSLAGGPVDGVLLEIIGHACSDQLVSIRKASLSALSEVFRKFLDEKVITEWLQAVPRLISDNETSIQEECESLFLELVMNWIEKFHKLDINSNTESLESVLSKELLALLKGMCEGDVDLCIKKICTSLGKKRKIKASVAIALQNVITASESAWLGNSMPIEKWAAPSGAWLLLSNISMFVPKAIGWTFLRHHWELLHKSVSTGMNVEADSMELTSVTWASDRVSLLQIISHVSLELPPEPAADLAHDLLQRAEGFNMHLTEVDAHVKALRTLCKRKAKTHEEGDILVSKWACQVLKKAVKALENYLHELSKADEQNGFATPKSARGRKDFIGVKPTTQVVTAVFTIGSVVLVCPSADTKDIVPLLHTIVTSGTTKGKPTRLAAMKISVKDTAPSLYIQSWVTLGKICLVDEKLAKSYIPLFMQELEKSNFAALRNNILLVMVDFCVRYTALIDCYIPKITKLLRDACEIVRRQAFILLSRLLQRDYVKWRGVLFLRFLLPLVDDSEKIRNLADFLFGNFLKVKAPLLAYNSFIEALFVLNDCHAHAGHSDASKSVSHLFSIRGNDEMSRSRRMQIYVSLLKQMAPEQLLATSAKLCAEILAAASDGLLNLEDVTAQSVLQDALQILACKEMRIQSSRISDAADVEEDGGEGGAVLAAKGRVVTQVSKKNLIQHVIPIFIELKRLLESKNSPLTGCLMECLCVLLKDYKNEIEDILVADRQLQKELLYDMQKYETSKAKSTITEVVTTMRRAEGFQSPKSHGAGCSKNVYARLSEKLGTCEKLSSAVADAAAKATARSVLKEVNKNLPTPPLHSLSVPKVHLQVSGMGGVVSRKDKYSQVLESVRRRQDFDSVADN